MIRSTLVLAAGVALLLGTSATAQPPATEPEPPAPDITVTGRSPGAPPPLAGPSDFISPMGEPFRSEDKLSGAEHWFAQADTDHDNRLTYAEYQHDWGRFFMIVDSDHDGVIGPAELQHYEVEIAPEITVVSTYGDVSKITTDSDGKIKDPPYPTRLGAGRYSYIAAPEPIASADANLDRGVTLREFAKAAEMRFKALDRNGDGAITRDELPRLSSPGR